MNHKQSKAVLCLDIDGTLTDAQENIHPRDIATLAHFPDHIQLIFTTGRILHSALGILHENNLFNEEPFPLPGVFMNGGVALLPAEERVVEHLLTPDLLVDLAELPLSFPDTCFAFFEPDRVSLVNPTSFGQEIAEGHYFYSDVISLDDIPREVVKLMAINQDKNVLEAIKARTQNLPAEMGYTLPFLYEINAPGINKAATLRVLLDELEMASLPVFAAGDGENDLSLMTLTERFFAPLTANETVRKRADEIINRQENGILMPVLSVINQLLD
ncbi:MAG: HAD family hydrolase [Chloroflexota bacterium]|nr:HAD family hydrolase [Chloroflexota bacterium]